MLTLEFQRPSRGLGAPVGSLATVQSVEISRSGDWLFVVEYQDRKRPKKGTQVVPMPPALHNVFAELWKVQRLDTNRVFLYNDKPLQRIGTAFKAACRRAGITNLRIHDFRHYRHYEYETGRG